MLTEICEYLRNWFCEDSDKIIGNIVVGDSEITVPYGVIQPGQYIRIIDSVFNNIDELNEYINNPEHLKVREYMNSVSYDKTVFDYEF